ncbi:MAG: carboxypeptidase, partial [Paenibacillaceae bacterium]|nr:carboxypeptidase [Paenibacillaceae bacterium]
MPKEPTQGDALTTKQVLAKIIMLTLNMLKWFLIVGIVCCFIGGGAAVGYVAALTQDDPVRSKDFIMEKMEENSLTGFVYFNDDTPVGQLRTEEDRRMATLDEIPQLMQDAVIAVEDNDFYTHHGVDIKGTLRAVMQKLLHEPVQTGGSTITQQLARRVFLTLDREDSRKAKEIFLSLRMERLLSKDQILLAYLNKVPYGNGSTGYNLYGIKAAAKGLFNINDLNELNVAEAAFLAGLPQQPSNFSSFTSKGEFDETGFNRAMTRQRLVLLRMLEENKIDQNEYDEAMSFDLKGALAEPGQKAYNVYPYLMIEAERQATDVLLTQQFPDLAAHPESNPDAYNQAKNTVLTQMLHEGYHIYTTIDKKIYDSMQEIARNGKNFTPDDPKKGVEQIGAVMLDNSTSAVLGMIEGRDFFTEQLNHATQALRQPGSSMKPIAAYIPAIEAGQIQPGEIIDDVPIVLKDGQKGFHIPENWDGDFHGLITARTALNQSYNIPAIKLFVNV